MTIEIQAKAYDSSCSAEEKKAIQDRVSIYKDDIILYHEMPVPSAYQLELFMKKLDKLTHDLGQYNILVDLRETSPPEAELRAMLKEYFSQLRGLKHFAACTGKNFIINLSAKFVIASFGIKSYSIHKTFEQALASIEKKNTKVEKVES